MRTVQNQAYQKLSYNLREVEVVATAIPEMKEYRQNDFFKEKRDSCLSGRSGSTPR